MKTETLRGVALIHKIRELEAQNIPVRSVTVGRTNAEWIIAWDDNPCYQTNILAEPFTQTPNPETLSGGNRGGHDGGHHPGSYSSGPPHFPWGEGPTGNQ